MSGEDLEAFYENIDFEIVETFEKASPSGTIKLKHVFPITAEAREDFDKDDEVDLVELAGRGGQKVVYKSLLHSNNRFLALAFMDDTSDLDEVESFFREARIAMSLKHPSIINTHNFGIDEKYGPYSVMNWVEGETLNNILKKHRQGVAVYEQYFTIEKLIEYYLDICKALSFAHSKDIIHLDIKPENILIDYDRDKAFLFDWGLAKAFSPLENLNIDPLLLNNDTKDGYFRGTPGYMSPEQISEQIKNQKTDIYQLGALLYTIIFKHCPVEGDNVEDILNKTLQGEIYIDSIKGKNLALIAICKKAMSPNPDDRYSDVRAIIDELKNVKFDKKRRDKRVLSFVVAALLPFVLLLGTFFLFDGDASEHDRIQIKGMQARNISETSTTPEGLLSAEDIELIQEFSLPAITSNKVSFENLEGKAPYWYKYLDNIMKREMGDLRIKNSDLLLKIENLISFYTMENGL